MMPRVFDLWYGYPHKGKTKGLVDLALELHKRTYKDHHGKKIRVYAGDGGVQTIYASGLVEEGIIEVCEYQDRDFPFTIIDAMVDLYWPEDPLDPKSKWVPAPADRLADTHILVAYEGLAVMGGYALSNIKGGCAYRHARGEMIGKDVNVESPIRIVDEKVAGLGDPRAFAGNPVGHYQLVQPYLLDAIKKSRRFPGWVVWTTHPVETADTAEGGQVGEYGKIIGKKITGPELCGKAKVLKLPPAFGNTLHFDTATKKVTPREQDEKTGKVVPSLDMEYRIYTRNHFDPDQQVPTEFIAGNRCPVPELMPDYFTSDEKGGPAILQFYERMVEAQRKTTGLDKEAQVA